MSWLHELDSFLEVLWKHHDSLRSVTGRVRDGTLYCPTCGEPRRMEVRWLYGHRDALRDDLELPGAGPTYAAQVVPSLLRLSCVQCEGLFTALLYPGSSGPMLSIFPQQVGGLRTPSTPDAVAYYLDQAQRAHSAGALSAAVAMYRGALEQLLFHQGFRKGMLKAKIDELEQQKTAGTAPRWAADLDTAFLTVLKELGDGAIHPNGGDVSKQAALDHATLGRVHETFSYLLFVVYEAPQRKAVSLSSLQAKSQILKK